MCWPTDYTREKKRTCYRKGKNTPRLLQFWGWTYRCQKILWWAVVLDRALGRGSDWHRQIVGGIEVIFISQDLSREFHFSTGIPLGRNLQLEAFCTHVRGETGLFFEGTKNICCKQKNKRTRSKKKGPISKRIDVEVAAIENWQTTTKQTTNHKPKKLYPKQNYNYKNCSSRKQNYRPKSSSTGVQYVSLQKYRRSLLVDPLDITAALHRRFPVQGHILSTGGAALTKVKLLADPLTHVPASPYAALAGATREFNELITPATRANVNLRVVTTPTTLRPPPPVTTPVSSSSTSTLEARKLINPTWAPTPRPEETGTTTDLPPVIPALLDDAKPAPVTPLPELWNTRRLLDTIAAMLLLVGFYFFCWFLSSLYVHSRYEGAEKKKKKSKQTTSEKNTHKKKKKKKRKMKMRVRTESERERRGCSLSTQRLQNNTKPQKNTHKNTKKKSREKGLGFRVLCL